MPLCQISVPLAAILGEHTQSIPPAEVAFNLAVGDFERNGEMGIGGGGGVSSEESYHCLKL